MPIKKTTKLPRSVHPAGSVTKTRKVTVLPPCRPAQRSSPTRREPRAPLPERGGLPRGGGDRPTGEARPR